MFYFKIDYYLIFFINSRLDHLGGAGTFSFPHSNYTGADRVGERPTTNLTHREQTDWTKRMSESKWKKPKKKEKRKRKKKELSVL